MEDGGPKPELGLCQGAGPLLPQHPDKGEMVQEGTRGWGSAARSWASI